LIAAFLLRPPRQVKPMHPLSFKLRNVVQRTLGLNLAHRVRTIVRPRTTTENGSCGCDDGWIYVYPTGRCNLTCSYCQNLHATGEFNPAEGKWLSPQAWIAQLNRIGRNVGISGGDPLAYPHLVEVVNGIDAKLAIVICTNFSTPNVLSVIQSFERPVVFDVTYHPSSGRAEHLIKTVNTLRAAGKFDGTIHAIAASKNSLKFLWKAQKEFASAGLQLKINIAFEDIDHEGSRKAKRETVYCSKNNINIGPQSVGLLSIQPRCV
jgi:organic radical activating enzyme